MIFRILGVFVTLFLIAACSSDDARLRDLYDVGTGPEEFAVLPVSYTHLRAHET